MKEDEVIALNLVYSFIIKNVRVCPSTIHLCTRLCDMEFRLFAFVVAFERKKLSIKQFVYVI